MCDKSVLDSEILDTMFSKQFEDFDSRNMYTNNRFESESGRCAKRPENHSAFEQLAGYENLNASTFHLQPEQKNTYHNYPVLQESGEYCSMNHQIFMNHTKRKLPVKQVSDENATGIEDLIPDAKPMFLKMNKCN